MNYLVVVAHPDDEVLGAGATIYKLIKQGHRVAVAIMNGDIATRPGLAADAKRAQAVLGIEKAYHGSFPNMRMNTVPHVELVQFVESCIQDWQAEAIITHHPAETNNDHVMTSYAVQAACRLFQRRANMPTLKELLYMEVPSSTEWCLDSSANRFTPNTFVEIDKEGLDIKIKALQSYSGVMRTYPHPRSYEALTGLAAYRGSQAGCNYAEAFETVFRRLV